MRIATAQSISLKEWEYLCGLKCTFKPSSFNDPNILELDFNEIPPKRKKLFNELVHLDIEDWFEEDGQGFGTNLPPNMVDYQFFMLNYKDMYFFANNEGYPYPRYILKIINYTD